MAFAKDRHRPPGNWVIFSPMIELVVWRDIHDATSTFADLAQRAEKKGWPYGLELCPEPANPFDPNAVAVYGVSTYKGLFGPKRINREKIGYLPREHAALVVRELVQPGKAFGVELYSVYRTKNGYVNVKLLVLGPPGMSEKARRNKRLAEEKALTAKHASDNDATLSQV